MINAREKLPYVALQNPDSAGVVAANFACEYPKAV